MKKYFINFKIEQDLGDLTMPTNFAFNPGRCSVAYCSMPTKQVLDHRRNSNTFINETFFPSFQQQFFYSKYPDETSKFFNLIRIISPLSWLCTFSSITLVVTCTKIITVLGLKQFKMKSQNQSIMLFPDRFELSKINYFWFK